MPGIACKAEGCTYNTADQSNENEAGTDQLKLLLIDTDITHPLGGRAADRGGAVRSGTRQSEGEGGET